MRRLLFRLDSARTRDRRALVSRPGLEAMEDRRLLTTILVTNTNDSGAGSLRQAILDANGTTGSDVIDFNIGTGGAQTIALTSAPLPTITDTVLIDGTTQPAGGGPAVTTPLIQIDGSALTTGTNDGLTINLAATASGPATIRGLAIGKFNGSGIHITGTGGNQVQQSLIGTNITGTAAMANGVGITIDASPNNIIGVPSGSTTTTFRNVISGNTGAGVLISGAGSSGNVVSGNLVGTDVGGTTAIPNSLGIQVTGAASNFIGGATAPARNVISGNTTFGIQVTGTGATNTTINGNYIGLNSSGNAAIANNVGVELDPGSSSNTVGGTVAAARNVIAGNTLANVQLIGSTNNLIVGNTMGLNADGSAAVNLTQASRAGLEIADGSTGNTVGGTATTANNVISGSAGWNVEIQGKSVSTVTVAAANNLVLGNFIGTNLAGTGAISTTAGKGGIVLSNGTTGNTIGGSSAGLARNVVSGNHGDGISLVGAGTSSNVIQGNDIGVQADATTVLANTGNGIFVDGATGNNIGGSVAGAGNVIAGNTGAGVFVNTGTGIAIQRNSIFSNTGLGIDLAPTGVNPNQPTSPGSGPNNLQNYPVLTSVSTSGNVTTVAGTLQAAPSTAYTIDLYANTAGAPSGHGQGKTYVGSTSVTTDSNGKANFSATTSTVVPLNSQVTATATDGAGNTSEFAANIANTAPTADVGLTVTATPEPVAAGGFLTYTIKVTNNGPSTATNVVVTDTLPSGVTFLGATSTTGTFTQSGSKVTANIGSLISGGTATVTITTVTSTTGALTNTATATLTETDANQANNTVTTTSTVVAGVDLNVTPSVNPGTTTVGSPSTITFTVTNTSSTTTATNVVLTAPLHSGVTLVSSSSSSGSTANNNGTVTANIGSLAPGATAQFNLVVSPTTTGNILTTATASASQPETNTTNNAATATLVVNSGSGTTPTTTGDGPRVVALDRTGYHRIPTTYVLTFDSPLESTSANNAANYTLSTAGPDGRFGTKDDRKVKIASVFYDATAHTVTIKPKHLVGLHQKVVLGANGTSSTGIRGTSGQLLDGADTGQPGSNFVRVFSGVGPGRISLTSVGASIAAKGKVRAHRARG